jgi:tetratricopeptide (TPR) repeat protein
MSAMPLLKFTPSAMDTEFLEAITVQRESLIQGLVDSALHAEGGNRHHLLVGPRGMGKSHVLTLVAERVRAAADDSLVLAVLDEDPWATRSYTKFFAAILGAIDHPDTATVRSRGTEEEAERLLRDAIGDRRLVLMVENLDEIFRRIGADGQKRFRAFAENWPQLLVLASTPQLFAGINRHASPFYAFFRITHLDELTPENAGDLLGRIARLRDDEALATFLETETARRRILAINALAGGHPRIWLLFAGCISIPAIDELVPLFLQALDDLTPYYQSRLADLGDQQQELVLLLCEAGGALTNRQLAEQSGLPQNQVGAALGKLEDRGYIRRALLPEELNTGDARASHWELREPLMRLALDVKHSRGKPLTLVVEFLRAWYGAGILNELVRLPGTARLAFRYATEALRALDDDTDLSPLLTGSPEEVLSRVERGLVLAPDNVGLQWVRASTLLDVGRYDESIAAIRTLAEALPRGPTKARFLLDANDLGLVADAPIVREDAARALAMLDASDAAPEVDELRGVAFAQLEQYEKSFEAFARASAARPDDPKLHRLRSEALARLGRDAEALDAITSALQANASEPRFHGMRADRLHALGRTDEAESAARKALELDDSSPWLWALAGRIALERGDRTLGRRRIEISLSHWVKDTHANNPFRERWIVMLLWLLHDNPAVLTTSVRAYEDTAPVAGLGRGLLEVLPSLLADPIAAERWLRLWDQAAPQLEVPIRMLRAALRYDDTRDRAHLLGLPTEQRKVLVELLQRREDRLELGHDVA